VPAGVRLDDDRTVTVNSFNINEGSPYAVFTVSATGGAAQAGQLVTLSLANVTTTGMSGLQYYDATASEWVTYNGGTVALDAAGQLLVRTSMMPEQETAVDNNETFTLTVTNTGGTNAVGTATVKDDGTGDYFAANDNDGVSTLPANVQLDDDRALSVNSLSENEADGKIVFTVTGVANQLIKLELQTTGTGTGHAALDTDVGANLEYSTNGGSSWQLYTTGQFVAIPSTGNTLMVRVFVTRDALVEGNETFYLAAFNTGGSVARGTGTIIDYAPAAVTVTADAVERGGLSNNTGGFNPSDVDVNSDQMTAPVPKNLVTINTTSSSGSLTLDSMANLATGNNVIVASTPINGITYTSKLLGAYGTVYFKTTGEWIYEIDNDNAAVQALRLSTNTLTETFTYTVGGDSFPGASAALTITIKGANDTPVANPDYNTAKESITAGLVGGASAYAPMNADNTAGDSLGYKAMGNVLPNDTDVDAGDTKSVFELTVTGTATGTTAGSSGGVTTLSFTTLPSNVSVGYFVFYAKQEDGVDGKSTESTLLKTASDQNITVTSIDAVNGTFTLSGAVSNYALTSSTILGFANNTSGAAYKEAAISGSTSTNTSTINITNFSGQIAVGMSVSGGGLTAGVSVTAVNYDADGKPVSVVISTSTSLASQTLTFSGSITAGQVITGRYGSLTLNSDGSYTYTPFTNNTSLSEGESVNDVFNYIMQDADGLTSPSTLTITVLGSGTNDPNAIDDANSATEAGSATSGASAAGNVLSSGSADDVADTTPVGTAPVYVVGGQPLGSSIEYSLYVTKTVTTVVSSTVFTVTSASNLAVGMIVKAGAATPGSTTITVTAIDSSTNTVTLSSAVTLADGTSLLFVEPSTQLSLLSGTTTVDSTTVTVTSTAGLSAGMAIMGTGIPAGTVILSVANETTLELSQAATDSGTGLALTAKANAMLLTGQYGSLTLYSDGSYSYTVNNANPTVNALQLGQSLTDVFAYRIANGYFSTGTNGGPAGLLLTDVANLTITINGSNDAPTLDLKTSDDNTVNYAATYTEGSAPVSLLTDTGVNIADVDNARFESLAVSYTLAAFQDDTISSSTDNAAERLVFTGATSGSPITLGTVTTSTTGSVTIGGVRYDYTVTEPTYRPVQHHLQEVGQLAGHAGPCRNDPRRGRGPARFAELPEHLGEPHSGAAPACSPSRSRTAVRPTH